MNNVALIGRLVRTPELRVTPSGISVTSFTIAINKPTREGEEQQADFIDCVVWDKQAENLCKYMDKGKQIAVLGSIQTRMWETKEGDKRKAVEVLAKNIEYLTPRTRSDE